MLIPLATLQESRAKLEGRTQKHQQANNPRLGNDSDTTQPPGLERREVTPVAAGQQSSANSKVAERAKNEPKVCECAKPHTRAVRAKKATAPARRNADKLPADSQRSQAPSKARKTGRVSNGDNPTSSTPSAVSSANIAKEKDAKKCTTCEKVVKPPRGKKLAWRRVRNSWVYAGLKAQGDDPPENEIMGNSGSTTGSFPSGALDSDDDEDVPPIKSDLKGQVVEASSNGKDDQCGSDGTASHPIVNASQVRGSGRGSETSAQTAASNSLARDAMKAVVSAILIGATPAATIDDHQQSPPRKENAKREAASPALRSQTKKPCHYIDLTVDDDEHDLASRQEPVINGRNGVDRPAEKDIVTLRYEFEAIKLEEKMLEAQQRKLAIQYELKRKQFQCGSLSKPIKVEEDS